jgi:hypothetical protein
VTVATDQANILLQKLMTFGQFHSPKSHLKPALTGELALASWGIDSIQTARILMRKDKSQTGAVSATAPSGAPR